MSKLREFATRANAMKAGGMDSTKIINRLLQSKTSPEASERITQARQQGMSDDKLVDYLSQHSERIQPTVTHKDPEGLLGFMGKVTGAEKLGTRLGSELGMATASPDVKRRLAEAESKGFVEKGTQRELSTGGVTDKQAWASAGATAMNLAAPFASKFLAPKGANTLSLLARGVPAGALEGGLMSTAEGDSFGQGALTGGAITGGLILGGAALQYFSKRLPKLAGILGGESEDTIKKGLENPEAFDLGLKNGEKNMRNSLTKLNKGFTEATEAFNEGHGQLTKDLLNFPGAKDIVTDEKTVRNILEDVLQKHKVKVTKNGLDFSNSFIKANGSEQSKILDVFNAMKNKKSWKLEDMNDFKQLVGKFQKWNEAGSVVSSNSPALESFYGAFDEHILSKLPTEFAKSHYSSNNKAYGELIPVFQDLVNSTGNKGSYNKLTATLKNHADKLFNLLEHPAIKDIKALRAGGEVAGTLGKKGGTLSVLNPATWTNFLLSPTTKGKIISGTGRALNSTNQFIGNQLSRNLPGSLGNVRNVVQQGARQLTAGGINLSQ